MKEFDTLMDHGPGCNCYENLLDNFIATAKTLLSVNDPTIWENLLQWQSRHDELEAKLPNVTDEEFDEYTVLIGALVVLHE